MKARDRETVTDRQPAVATLPGFFFCGLKLIRSVNIDQAEGETLLQLFLVLSGNFFFLSAFAIIVSRRESSVERENHTRRDTLSRGI